MTLILTFLGTFFKNILSNWKLLVAIIVLAFSFYGYLKIKHVYKDLEQSKIQLVAAKETNEKMVGEIDKAKKINEENSIVIKQLQDDKETSRKAIENLKTKLTNSSKKYNDVKTNIEKSELQEMPTPEIINDTLLQLQKLREQSVKE